GVRCLHHPCRDNLVIQLRCPCLESSIISVTERSRPKTSCHYCFSTINSIRAAVSPPTPSSWKTITPPAAPETVQPVMSDPSAVFEATIDGATDPTTEATAPECDDEYRTSNVAAPACPVFALIRQLLISKSNGT